MAQGKAGKVWLPQRALSTCFLKAGEASALSRFTRGRKGRIVIFLPFSLCCLPFSLCGAALLPPCSLPRVSQYVSGLSVVFSPCLVWPQLSLWLSYPSCLTPTPLGLGPCFSGHRNSAQVLSPVGKIHFPACARPAGAKWLNLQPMFSSYSTDVAQGLGEKGPRVTCLLWGPLVGAGWRGEGACLSWTFLILGKS